MQGLVQLLCQSGVAASATQAILDDRAAACVPRPLHAVASTAGGPWPSSCSNGRSLLASSCSWFDFWFRVPPSARAGTALLCANRLWNEVCTGCASTSAVVVRSRWACEVHSGKMAGQSLPREPVGARMDLRPPLAGVENGRPALEQRSGLAAQGGVGVLCRLLAVSPLSDADCRAGIRGPHFRRVKTASGACSTCSGSTPVPG